MDGSEPKIPAAPPEVAGAGGPPASGLEEGPELPAATQPATGAAPPVATEPAAGDPPPAEPPPEARPAFELGEQPAPAEATGETPQTTSIAPTPAVTERIAARSGLRPSRLRLALLTVLGGIAAVGALALPFVWRGSGDAAPGIANAASLAGVVSGVGVGVDDGGEGGAGDGSDVDGAGTAKPAAWRVARLADDEAVTLVEGTMGKRPLLAALSAAGVSRSESHRMVASLEDVREVDHLDPKDTFVIARDKASGRVVAFEISSSPIDVWQGREDVGDDGTPRLVAQRLPLTSEKVRIRKAVLVGADLRASFVEAGLAPIDDVLSMLDDALEGHAELSDIRAGARLRIIATLERVDGAFVRWSSLDAVEYFPASSSASPVRVYWFGDDDHRHGWYDSKGRQPTHGGWRMPIPLARVASPFNPHRMHPVLHVIMPHNGVDLRASTGTPVYATAAGTVTGVGNDGPCGNKVEISHPAGITSIYCHLSRFAAGLHVGQHVEGRQLIAYVGQTGRVTGPHLHFAIKKNGQFVDPMTLRLDGVRVVARGRRDDFDRLRASIDAELDAIPLPAQVPPNGEPPSAREPSESETFYEEP